MWNPAVFVLLATVSWPAQERMSLPDNRCELQFVAANSSWNGRCGRMLGETESTLVAKVVATPRSGRWRGDSAPTLVLLATLSNPAGETVTVEIEFHSQEPGLIRTATGWFQLVDINRTQTRMTFRIDVREAPSTDLDRLIIERAAKLIASEAVWDRSDDRKCSPEDKTFSIYCALERATVDATGGSHHRRPALAVVRTIVDKRSAGRNYAHRLMDYNNDSTTKLSDVHSLFSEALAQLKAK